MPGQPVEERTHGAGSAEGEWKAVMDWYLPRGDAERDRLDQYSEKIAMQQGMTTPSCSSLVPKGSIIQIKLPQVGSRGSSPDHTSSSLRSLQRGAAG